MGVARRGAPTHGGLLHICCDRRAALAVALILLLAGLWVRSVSRRGIDEAVKIVEERLVAARGDHRRRRIAFEAAAPYEIQHMRHPRRFSRPSVIAIAVGLAAGSALWLEPRDAFA